MESALFGLLVLVVVVYVLYVKRRRWMPKGKTIAVKKPPIKEERTAIMAAKKPPIEEEKTKTIRVTTNRFSSQVNSAQQKRQEIQDNIVAFSSRLAAAMGLDVADIKQADRHEVSWHVGEWKIVPQNRCFNQGWVNILEVVPEKTPDNYGYSNTCDPNTSRLWHYRMHGTGTEILPPRDVQDKIIAMCAEGIDGDTQEAPEVLA